MRVPLIGCKVFRSQFNVEFLGLCRCLLHSLLLTNVLVLRSEISMIQHKNFNNKVA